MDHEAYLNNRRARYEINLVSAAAIIKEEMKGLEKVTMRLRSNYYRVARNRHQTREGVFIPVVFPIFSIFFFSNHFLWIISILDILSIIFSKDKLKFANFIFIHSYWQAFSRKNYCIECYLSIFDFYDVSYYCYF